MKSCEIYFNHNRKLTKMLKEQYKKILCLSFFFGWFHKAHIYEV